MRLEKPFALVDTDSYHCIRPGTDETFRPDMKEDRGWDSIRFYLAREERGPKKRGGRGFGERKGKWNRGDRMCLFGIQGETEGGLMNR